NSGKAGVVDVDRVRLLDAAGRNLVANGDFADGGDRWFFKTHSHLPWHLKNVWVHTVFAMGIVGLVLFAALSSLAWYWSAQVAWGGSAVAGVLVAWITGLLVVGRFDCLLDEPWIAMLLLGMLFVGVGGSASAAAPHAAARARPDG